LIKSRRFVFFLLFILLIFKLGANETRDSYIQMLINEKTGRYSISFLTDPENMKYRQLIYRNSNTSFLDVKVNDIPYRLGSSRAFKTRVTGKMKSLSLSMNLLF